VTTTTKFIPGWFKQVGKSTHWLHLDPWWRGGYGSIKTLCGRHVTIESRHGEVTATLKWERLQRKPILTDVCVRCLTVTAAHRRDTFPGTPADFRGPAIYYHIDGGPEYLEEELRKKDERQARHEAAKKEAMEQAWRDAGLGDLTTEERDEVIAEIKTAMWNVNHLNLGSHLNALVRFHRFMVRREQAAARDA